MFISIVGFTTNNAFRTDSLHLTEKPQEPCYTTNNSEIKISNRVFISLCEIIFTNKFKTTN